jgi:hypothetical protein
MTELAPQPMRRAASFREQPESTKAKARRRRSSNKSALPSGLGIGVLAESRAPTLSGCLQTKCITLFIRGSLMKGLITPVEVSLLGALAIQSGS